MIGIYNIIHMPSGTRYIGQSVNIEKRNRVELSALRRGKSDNAHLQSAWNKYGEEQFVFSTLFSCATERLTICEQGVYDLFQAIGIPCYNEGPFLDHPMRGKHHSLKTKQKISKALLGNKNTIGLIHTAETKQKISKAMLGRKGHNHTDETKQKLSIARLGRKNPRHIPETIEGMAANAKLHWAQEQTTTSNKQ